MTRPVRKVGRLLLHGTTTKSTTPEPVHTHLGVDDAAVYRRLCGDRKPSLTLAEQEVIVGIAVQRRWSGERLGDVLGIEPGSATRKVDRYRLRMSALDARSQNERESNVA